jgi:hypothetical protein
MNQHAGCERDYAQSRHRGARSCSRFTPYGLPQVQRQPCQKPEGKRFRVPPDARPARYRALTGLFVRLMLSRRREPVAQPVEQLTFNLVGANAPAGNWLFCLAFALSSSS